MRASTSATRKSGFPSKTNLLSVAKARMKSDEEVHDMASAEEDGPLSGNPQMLEAALTAFTLMYDLALSASRPRRRGARSFQPLPD